jgi:putative ubiquitin-RnfH superfamily antitoxin RatB of RatAB toxin-antitoxin module
MMQIQCLFSPSARQLIDLSLTLPEGCTVFDAVQCLKLRPELHDHLQVLETSFEDERGLGIWGRIVQRTSALKPGDRLEIYRPLLVDPKMARKKRFKGQGKGRTGLFARRRVGAVAGY